MQVAESVLEDWIAENLDQVFQRYDVQLIGRQLTLPSGGRLDVLALEHNVPEDQEKARSLPTARLTVIEVKRDKVRASTVTQVMGYMGSLAEVVDELFFSLENYNIEVYGMVAAPEISTDARLALRAHNRISFFECKVSICGERRYFGSFEAITNHDKQPCKEFMSEELRQALPTAEEAERNALHRMDEEREAKHVVTWLKQQGASVAELMHFLTAGGKVVYMSPEGALQKYPTIHRKPMALPPALRPEAERTI